jgi:chromosome segregation ATPase
MSQEKYLNHYVELLKSTLNDQISRNLQLQATAKTQEEIMKEMNVDLQTLTQQVQQLQNTASESVGEKENELNKQVEQLKNQINQLNQSRQNDMKSRSDETRNLNSKISELQNQLTQPNPLSGEVNGYKKLVDDLKDELLSLNKEVALMESLRNQLISTQNMVKDRDAMIGDLSQQIENLKTTPTTVKKTKKASVESVSTLEMATEDGGSF